MAEGESGSSKPHASGDAPLDWAKFTWEALKGIVAGTAAVFAFFASQQSGRNAEALNTLKFQAEARAQQSALDIKVFELLEKTLSLEGAAAKGHGVAAAAIINALTMPPLRDGFLNALYAASRDQALLKQLDEAKEFDTQGTSDGGGDGAAGAASPRAGNMPDGKTSRIEGIGPAVLAALVPSLAAQSQLGALKGYRVDVFYCEAQVNTSVTDGRRKRAQAAADRIMKATGNSVDVRVRLLPTLVQARPEYRSSADEIRFEDEPREAEAAKALASLLSIRAENMRKVTAGRTPSYIGVFYCGP